MAESGNPGEGFAYFHRASGEKGKVRQALADYIWSEGCACCRNNPAHTLAQERLAKLLDVPPYADGSGYDFGPFRSAGFG